jgi:hypothetical protein
MIDLVRMNKNKVQIRKVLIKLLLNTKKLDKLKKRSSKTFKLTLTIDYKNTIV